MNCLVDTGQNGLKKGEKGQALIEFTLTAPLILMILIGVVFFTWVMYDFVVLRHAVHEGAKYAVVPEVTSVAKSDPDTARQMIIDRVKENLGILDPDEVNVTIEGEWLGGTRIDVIACYFIRVTEVTVPYIVVPGNYTFPPIRVEALASGYVED
jgi:Flp pilus assembly protein TadG